MALLSLALACSTDDSDALLEASPESMRAKWSLAELHAAAPSGADAPVIGDLELSNVSGETLYLEATRTWDHTVSPSEHETGDVSITLWEADPRSGGRFIEFEPMLLAPGDAVPASVVMELSWISDEPQPGTYDDSADFIVYSCSEASPEDCVQPSGLELFGIPLTVTLTE